MSRGRSGQPQDNGYHFQGVRVESTSATARVTTVRAVALTTRFSAKHTATFKLALAPALRLALAATFKLAVAPASSRDLRVYLPSGPVLTSSTAAATSTLSPTPCAAAVLAVSIAVTESITPPFPTADAARPCVRQRL